MYTEDIFLRRSEASQMIRVEIISKHLNIKYRSSRGRILEIIESVRENLILLLYSELMRPHLEHSVQFLCP